MKLLRMIWLTGFLGLMSLAAQQVSQASAMQPPKFTLTDLGSVDGQANPYTPPTGYTMREVYDPNIGGHRIGLTFTKDGNANNLLPDYINTTYILTGYNSSGIVFGDDFNTNSSFYYNTNTSEYGNFKGSWVQVLGISSLNSLGQALGATYKYFSDGTSLFQATFYTSFLSDPVILKDLLVNSSSDWVLLNGAGLNDNGQIYGTMFNTTTRQSDYYRLDPVPVPEPSTILILTAGGLIHLVQNLSRKSRRI
jgi:hypothetical protein